MDLFSTNAGRAAPLAERVRPSELDGFVGQGHLLGPGSLLRRAVSAGRLGSCVFYGPPGTGKTTLANIIANTSGGAFVKLNAVSSGVADAKKVIDEARANLKLYGRSTYLLLDECHCWNKAQSDCMLAAIEDGSIIFIGSTTENPNVAMTRAIVSRCRIFEFMPLSEPEIEAALRRAAASDAQLNALNPVITDAAYRFLAWAGAGDLRSALNALELAVITTPAVDGVITVGETEASQSIQKRSLSVDESMYYDMLSAFCKSLRGSDPNAALYWSHRLTKAGCDPMLLFRRLIAHASEESYSFVQTVLYPHNAQNTA
ncbi:MAG: AAA family ATPase [Firmicutes bacterium]|nr:AAA family ATPase [Bacillota bacterium]